MKNKFIIKKKIIKNFSLNQTYFHKKSKIKKISLIQTEIRLIFIKNQRLRKLKLRIIHIKLII